MIQMNVSSPYKSKMIINFNISERQRQVMRVKSMFRSKRLHIIPEEAREDDKKAQPANSEEDSDEFNDDIKNSNTQ